MVSFKKIAAVAASTAIAAAMAVTLSGCGEDVAATWAHGKIMEEDITKAATNEMSSYVKDDGSTDVDAWTKYIEERQYESEDEDADADESSDSKDEKSDSKSESKEKGTVAEYREHLIKQKLRSEITKYQIKEQKIEVTEEEIDTEVDNEAAMYEAYYGGGMSGTFESIVNNYFGMTMEQFRESVSEYLAEQKLKEATVGSEDTAKSEESAEETKDSDSKDADESKSSDSESVDYDKLFEEYLDGQVESANLNIKDCPSELSYAPAVVAKNAESSSSESTESSDDSEDSNASDSDSSSGDDATKDDDSATKEDK